MTSTSTSTSTAMPTLTFTVSALPPSELERIRATSRDDFGNPLETTITREAGAPLRCCLRDATVGEKIALISYRPEHSGGPYSEVGPVFIHAERCEGYAAETAYPQGFRHRTQLFRAHGPTGRQVHNQIVEPGHQDAVLTELLNRPDIEFIHSRNVLAGCYMFSVRRASAPEPRSARG